MKFDAKNIVDKYGTPTFVYEGEDIFKNYDNLMIAFGSECEIFFSIKSNPNISIAKLLRNLGGGIEVASSGELYIALKAGFSKENIIFSGPGKTIHELKVAIEQEILCIMVESLDEIILIKTITEELNIKCKIGFRVNAGIDSDSILSM